MQDRFRFRVWSIQVKQMIYNAEIAYDGTNYYTKWQIGHNINDAWVDCFGYYLDYEHEDYEIMQCTGLKDKNGKLIFEHDIVKTLYTRPDGVVINRNCVVEFNRCAFWINYGIGASYLDNDDCIYEVIGNIYENKELFNDK